MLSTANFRPGNRYPEIAEQVRALCVTYDLPYTTGPLLRQYPLTVRTICKLALPDRLLFATSDDAPEAASEDRFRNVAKRSPLSQTDRPSRRLRALQWSSLSRLFDRVMYCGSSGFGVHGDRFSGFLAKPQLSQQAPMRGERQRDRVAPWRNPAE